MEEVLELVSEEQNTSASSEDLAAALDVPTTLKSFVVVDGEDELRRIMAEPLEKWRVFLHPTQRKIVQKEYSGSLMLFIVFKQNYGCSAYARHLS